MRGIEILRTSPFGHSRKLNFAVTEFSEVRDFLGALEHILRWSTYTPLTQGYAAFVRWPAERREKGASKFETVRNGQVTAKITHLREVAPHHTRYSGHNCKCVARLRCPPRPLGKEKDSEDG
jgi:hypothetical protein